MKYEVINVRRLHNAVEESMKLLNNAPIVDGENQDRQEKLKELSLVINIENIEDITITKAIPSDLYSLVEYDLELVEGVRDFEKHWNYTYHRLYDKFFDKCVEELRRNLSTRRAVLPIAGDYSYDTVHPPCLQNIMFKINNGRLDTTVIFRSNDGVKAFAMNSFGIARLIHNVADKVGVKPGSYTHIAQSFHAYQNDWETLDAYCELFELRRKTGCFYTMEEYEEVFEEYAEEYREQCEYRRAEQEREDR